MVAWWIAPINDTLRPFGVHVTTQPITPGAILTALAEI
jgi:hypothetical protein